jgi:hypothetical protein
MLLRRRMMGKSGGSIPYQRIEYLESTGTQYIDTGIKYNSSNKYNVECNLIYTTAAGGNTFALNGWDAGGAFGLRDINCVDGSNLSILTNAIGLDLKISLEIQSGSTSHTLTSILYNANTYSASRPHAALATYASNSGYIIFACYSQNSVNYFVKEKIYGMKIFVNDVIVRDFIPVRVGTTGYLYDTVSGQLYGNSGTGNFILGSDIN